MRLTAEGLQSPELRETCAPGTGQIYRFVPLYETSSTGYVGRNETSLWQRIQGHKTPNSECKALANAIAKHGLDQMDLVVLDKNIPVRKLASAERYWVAKYDTYNKGYNCTPGGEAPPLCSPEVAAKVKATKNTPESRAKTVAAARRHWDNPEEHDDHATALRSSLKKSTPKRLAALQRVASRKREAKMAGMSEKDKIAYVRKCDAQSARNAVIQKQLELLRTIPGYEASSRRDVLKALRDGVLRRG